jgi:hypothetical protein
MVVAVPVVRLELAAQAREELEVLEYAMAHPEVEERLMSRLNEPEVLGLAMTLEMEMISVELEVQIWHDS